MKGFYFVQMYLPFPGVMEGVLKYQILTFVCRLLLKRTHYLLIKYKIVELMNTLFQIGTE